MKKSAPPPSHVSGRRSLPRRATDPLPTDTANSPTAVPPTYFENLEPRMLLSGTPYNGQPGLIAPGTRVEAELFDAGGQGVSYFDIDASNNGGAFRAADGVDIQATTDTDGGFNVGWTADGEWLEYLVVATSGTYDVSARVASALGNPGQLRLLLGDGTNFSEIGTLDIQSTGGWQTWQTLTLNDIAVNEGPQFLRAEIIGGGFNVNWFGFENAASSGTTTAVQSGNWGDSSTWSHGVPDADKRAIISQGNQVTLNTDGIAKQIVVHGTLDVAELTNQTINLTTDWMHVNSGGVFSVGSATDRYDQGNFNLTLTGTDANADYTIETAMGSMQIMNNDGFLMAAGGGRLQFFGEEKLSFTKLSQTASVGSNSIVVENVIERNFDGTTSAASDGQLNWEVGDQIVIASSTRSYQDQAVRTITGVTDLGNGTTRLNLNAALTTRHYGEIEFYDNGTRSIDMRAEVALLSRNVKVQGIASQDTDSNWGNRALFNSGSTGDHRGISGHIMIMPTAGQISVEGVQLDRLGQTGTLGRYPIHWHLAGDRTGDVLKGVSVTNSNNRGVTVHGTHNLLIQDVVLHDIHGHGFFMEDAVENGNQFLSNITFGIHQVGAVGDQVNLSDPFIVDTHDHVGQNFERFLSSAGYWMTNPANIWIGNISAGSEGTGFWFIFPDSAIGLSAQDPQYANVRPDRTNLWTFDYNSSHSSPIGLNFDRGSDIEVPVGAQLKSNFDGDEHRPSAEPQINNYTAYKHTTGIYHRGRTANFNENRFADNFTSTFITFTQRITNALYVGHSQGNSNPSDIVTGHTFYDGANTLDGTHFAGFTANNAHTFRSHGAAQRLTHFVMSDTSFENDGTANNVSFSNPQGFLSYDPVGKTMPSVIYDADGTFTSHVGGQAGSTIVPNNPFFYNDDDFLPAGWNARVSDDLYAMFRMREPVNNALFRVTSPDGESGTARPGTGQFNGTNTLMKRDDGDYTVDFPEGLGVISNGFDIKYNTLVGPRDGSTMVRFVNVAQTVTPSGLTRVQNVATLRNTNGTAFATDGNDLWVKFSDNIEVDFVPGTNPPIEPPNENELRLSAVDDAYIQNTTTLNDNLLRLETSGNRTRTAYLKFDVPDTPGKTITDATLRVTVSGDPGTNLRLRVFEGGSNNWTENNLSTANAPSKAALLDEITGNWVIGQTYEFDVSAAVSAGQEVTFVIDSDGSLSNGDAAFASSENANAGIRPQLVVNLEDAPVTQLVGEVGRLDAVNHEWRRVQLSRSYVDPVVVVSPASYNGQHPTVVRVRNVSANAFDVRLEEWEYLDGSHANETLHYMVVEAGRHTLADGRELVAGHTDGLALNWQSVSLGGAMSATPVVLAQVVTEAGFHTVTPRLNSVTATGFDIRLQEEEATDGYHFPERVSWLALGEGGSGSTGSLVARTGAQVSHQPSTLGFGDGFDATPALMAQIQSFFGGDPVALRYYGLSADGATVFVEEEKSFDDEIAHFPEDVGFAAFTLGDLSAFTTPGASSFATSVTLATPTAGTNGLRVELAGVLQDLGDGSQDGIGGATYTSDGLSAQLTGNTSTRLGLDYTLTANTVLEFDLSVANPGEIVAIGFDNDNDNTNGAWAFQLAGTQTWSNANQAYRQGPGSYQIRVGDFFTGAVTQLVLTANDSVNALADVTFSNLRLYEAPA